jgi:hypothetical protein
MNDTSSKDSMSTAVVAILALVLIVWGWTRAHSTPDMNEVSAPPKTTRGPLAPIE